jgi:hypothetical protein
MRDSIGPQNVVTRLSATANPIAMPRTSNPIHGHGYPTSKDAPDTAQLAEPHEK